MLTISFFKSQLTDYPTVTIFWILTNLLTVGTIQQKRLSYTSTSNSSLLLVYKSLLSLSPRSLCRRNTIDHDIFLTLLSSWFGIRGYVLSWFNSYLSSRTFCIKYNNFSSLYTPHYGVPQCSVSGLLLFMMYTTPLSTLISSVSLYYHVYADYTQLFSPPDFQNAQLPPDRSHTYHFPDDF